MSEQDESNGSHITRRELGQELRSFRNEMRLLIVGAVIANQTLLHTDASGPVTAVVTGIPAGAAAFIAAAHWLGWFHY